MIISAQMPILITKNVGKVQTETEQLAERTFSASFNYLANSTDESLASPNSIFLSPEGI